MVSLIYLFINEYLVSWNSRDSIRARPLWRACQNEVLVFISILALVWHFCIQPLLKPGRQEIIFFTLFCFVFVLVWTDCNSLTFVCFSETFLPSSNEESLACRSFTDSLLETFAVHSSRLSLCWLVAYIAQHSFFFLDILSFVRCQQGCADGIPVR